ncbi:MAG: M3 family metallopeptidase [Shimia sp.]
MTNPLLAEWDTPFGLPPYGSFTDADFEPGLHAALEDARAEVQAIAGDPAAPSFANTIAEMERAGEGLRKVAGTFYHAAATDLTPEREALQPVFSRELAAYSAEVMTNAALFARIDALMPGEGLTPEQQRLLTLTHRDFVRGGAALEGEARSRMTEVKTRLAELGTRFTQNLLADERDWAMPLAEADLEGLPDFLIDATRAAAAERGEDGHVVTLSRSVVVPFLQFSPRRDLRETAYRAWAARGANGGETDNRAIAAETLALRHERAELLGFADFAHYKLAPEMAGTPDAVRALLMQVWAPAKAAADRDAEVLTRMMADDGVNGPLEPWDWRYYSEARRKAEHDLDEGALKPYLQLDRMIEAAFDCAHRLFGLEFRAIDAPLGHPDARAWEITRGGRHMAVLVGDYFARAGKRSGAWCGTLRQQQKLGGDVRPIVTNVCNFAKGDPALLSFDDARTLFHEFGHALHHILSDVTYPGLSGTSVARDFVELPSQLYEHWLEVPEVLGRFATHATTGEAMPRDLLERMLGAATYDAGFNTVEYIASALVDLDFHEGSPPTDPMARQAEVLAEIGMPHAIGMRHATPQFAHVFAGDGYSSGYYSYMWSEVMDADAFAAFEEAGDPFDPDTAAALERDILSVGGSVPPDAAYTAFRGRMPGVEPLLEGRGLTDAA